MRWVAQELGSVDLAKLRPNTALVRDEGSKILDALDECVLPSSFLEYQALGLKLELRELHGFNRGRAGGSW